MATGEYNYAVNQNVNSFHDIPSKELDVFLKLPMMSMTCPECDMEFSRKDAMQRHKRSKHGTTQPYPQSSDTYPPSSQAIYITTTTDDTTTATTTRCFTTSVHLNGD